MRCLYCDEDYMHNSSLYHYLFSGDMLCERCRHKLIFKPQKIMINDMSVLGFYVYDDSFRSLIIQYKECHDEALKDVFLYDLKDYINLRYHGYTLIHVPSSVSNLKRRSFDHMGLMLEGLHLKHLDMVEKIEDISQNALNRTQRLKMTDNFKLREGYEIPDKVLLIDDILTTGSSLYGVYKLFRNHVTKIKVMSLAYVKR